jgi:hypothetical protein
VLGGTVTLTSDIVSSNSAVGGSSTDTADGYGIGGGLYLAGGTVTLRSDTVTGNFAQGGTGRKHQYNGKAYGGGIFIGGATVYIDAFTLKHTTHNNPDNIYGSYILI